MTTTVTGLKVEGQSENERNATNSALYKRIIREVYKVTDVIVAHHLTYVATDKHPDGYSYEIVEEIPAADTLIFDHEVAKKLWGVNAYKDVLARLAVEPCETRDDLLGKMLDARGLDRSRRTSASMGRGMNQTTKTVYSIEFRVPVDHDEAKVRALAKQAARTLAQGADTKDVVIYSYDYFQGHQDIMLDD